MAYDRLAETIIKHSKLIVVLWIVILLIAAVPAAKSFGAMSYNVDDMGLEDSESMVGLEVIAEYFPSSNSGADISSNPMLVLGYSSDEEHALAEKVLAELEAAVQAGSFDVTLNDGTTVSKIQAISPMMDSSSSNPKEDGSGIIIATVSYNPSWQGSVIDDTPVLRQQITDVLAETDFDDPIQVALTGSPAISYDMETGATEDISHIDIFTILMVLILVGLFFRSFVTSATPPITMGVALLVTLAIVFGLSYVMDIFFITEMMLIVSMFGAGCDYCIFIIARYREEMRDGKSHHDALHSAIKWAGESITISGASVIIGFGAMSICSFSMVSTMGMCLAIGIIIALLAALTFIPSVLAIVGDRIFWPTRIKEYSEGGKATKGWYAWAGRVGRAYFERSSHFTLKHAKAITVVAILVTLPAAYVALTSETSYDMTSSMMTGESGEGMDLIGEYADQGMIYPNYVVIEYDSPVAEVGVAYDLLTQEPAGYTLTWTDSWNDGGSQSLNSMMGQIQSGNDNIASIYGPYMWNTAAQMAIADAGITDPTDALQLMSLVTQAPAIMEKVIGSAPATVGLVLEQAIPEIRTQYIYYLKNGAFDEYLGGMTVPSGLEANVADALILMTGAPTVDYIVNSNLGLIGGAFASSETHTGDVTFIKLTSSTHDAAMSQTSMDSISYMSGIVSDYAADAGNGVANTWVTGSAVIMYDISNVISGEFNHIEILVIILIIILLFFVMRSYTIPFRSVLTILMSICWTLAATHLIFGNEVTWLIPLILLVICLGLGMDYDILLTTRIKENVRSNGMSNDDAIHHAVIHSGSVITICGLIMGGAFGTLMLSSMGMLQQFGFALCFAILVDALIVRTYIVPAVMHLLGDWNWKGPRFLMTKDEKAALAEKKDE